MALLDRILAGDPGHAKALHARGRLELQRGRPAVAVVYLRRGVAADPSDVESLYTLYQCLQQIGTPAEIRVAEERWRQCDADLKRVGELVRIIAASPRDPDRRREIGELFLRNGQKVEGLRWLDTALELDPGHRATHRVLADYYGKTGPPELARKHAFLAEEPRK